MDFTPPVKNNEAPEAIIQPSLKPWFILFNCFFRSIWIFIFVYLFFIGFFIRLFESYSWFIWIAVGIFAVIFIILFFWERMILSNMKYLFFKDRVEYVDGFLVKNKKSIMFSRITNIWQKQEIIERFFGLWTVYLETAWSPKPELVMNYLENSEGVYSWITKAIQLKDNK